MKSTTQDVPRWQRITLRVAAIQCLIWGVFIVVMPERSSIVYGFSSVPKELFLWQGTGLIIFLFGIGYAIASANPRQHWAVILIGLLAKVLGPAGILWSVLQGDVAGQVLYLIPFNDLIWWWPFTVILMGAFKCHSEAGASGRVPASTIHP